MTIKKLLSLILVMGSLGAMIGGFVVCMLVRAWLSNPWDYVACIVPFALPGIVVLAMWLGAVYPFEIDERAG